MPLYLFRIYIRVSFIKSKQSEISEKEFISCGSYEQYFHVTGKQVRLDA